MTADDLVSIFCKHLARGSLDEYIPKIIHATNARQVFIRSTKLEQGLAEFGRVGTKVRITTGIKPKYLIGMSGVVVARPSSMAARHGTIAVDMGAPIRRYGRILGIPASCLEAA
jgi:hypothetical protein